MDNWRKISENRLIKDQGLYAIVIPDDLKNRIPLECPVCKFLMSTHDDVITYQDLKCCLDCKNTWADSNRQQWLDGWRPSPEVIEKETIDRNKLPSVMY